MNIAFDVHGVCDKDTTLIKEMMIKFREMGHRIFILSGPPLKQVNRELYALGFKFNIHFDCVLSVVNYLTLKQVPMWKDKNGRFWTTDENWWSSKAAICKANDVAMLYDDSEQYSKYFPPEIKFILWR